MKGKTTVKAIQARSDLKANFGRTYSKQFLDFEDEKLWIKKHNILIILAMNLSFNYWYLNL